MVSIKGLTEQKTTLTGQMEKIDVIDEEGAMFSTKVYKGKVVGPLVPDDFEAHQRALNSLGFTKDDLIIVSYPKSGTHWTFEIANMILKRSTEYSHAVMQLIDCTDVSELRQSLTQGPKIFTSHFQPQFLPETALTNSAKIIYVYRNPKDVAVSLFNFMRKLKMFECYRNAEWKNFLNLYLDGKVPYGDWFSHVKDWMDFKKMNTSYPVLMLCYEEMKENLQDSVGRIADFLKVDIDESFISKIAQSCQFQNMHYHNNSSLPQAVTKITDLKENIFYRKGEVGDWVNWFTVAQNEQFDKRMEALLEILNLCIRYTI